MISMQNLDINKASFNGFGYNYKRLTQFNLLFKHEHDKIVFQLSQYCLMILKLDCVLNSMMQSLRLLHVIVY